MMINEFTQRTGFTPTEDYYHTVIEPEYNRSNLDKDVWCKEWKKNGGIQKAYDALREKAAIEYCNTLSLESKNKALKEENANIREEYRKLVYENDELTAKIEKADATLKKMVNFLISKGSVNGNPLLVEMMQYLGGWN